VKKGLQPLLVTSLLLISTPMMAETLLLDTIEQAPPNDAAGVPRPQRGESMDQVWKRFGSPGEELPAVGNPPITRWVYDRFTVYFEDRSVINSVLNR